VKILNEQTQNAIAYACNAISFIFLKKEIAKHVKNIYLFGSAVRGELNKSSDIDLFFDCEIKNQITIEKDIKSALSLFYDSKDYEKWKNYKFTYPLSIQSGDVKTWELYTSILSEGILLYSQNIATSIAERKVLFFIVLPKNKKKYLTVTRALFGRKEVGYASNGLLSKIDGEKLSATVFFIKKEHQQKIMHFLNKEKIMYSMKEIAIFE